MRVGLEGVVMGDKGPNLLWVLEEPRFLQILLGRVDAISPKPTRFT